jgi:nucleotide-binding universal stress UspA family protein
MKKPSNRNFKQILIAVDDSAFAAHAADVGIKLAKSLHAEVGFVHAFDPAVAPGTAWGVTADKASEMSERSAKHLLAAFRERAATPSKVREFLESGKPALKIIDAAKNWPADLIVMGSHGRGKIQGLLLGSVSQEVLHHASCPVLVVRAQG